MAGFDYSTRRANRESARAVAQPDSQRGRSCISHLPHKLGSLPPPNVAGVRHRLLANELGLRSVGWRRFHPGSPIRNLLPCQVPGCRVSTWLRRCGPPLSAGLPIRKRRAATCYEDRRKQRSPQRVRAPATSLATHGSFTPSGRQTAPQSEAAVQQCLIQDQYNIVR